MPENKIVSHAKVGIIGGGIMGVSLLYHLAKEGWKDLILLEKGELTSGSTWHAAGQCPQMMGSYNLAKVHLESTNLYKKLEKETEQSTGFHDCGSLRLAYKKEDLDWFKYVKGILDNIGAPAEIISTNGQYTHNILFDCIKKGSIDKKILKEVNINIVCRKDKSNTIMMMSFERSEIKILIKGKGIE